MTTVRACRCRVGAHTIALDLSAVVGVERAADFDRAGPVPVIDAAQLIGLGESDLSDCAGQLVLTTTPSGPAALRVDAVSPAFEAPASAVTPIPRLLAGGAFAGVLRLGDELLPWLSPNAAVVAPAANVGPRSGGAGDRLLVLPLSGRDGPERPWAAALPAAEVHEVLFSPAIAAVPGAPAHVRGVAAWRGGVIAVVDVAAWLGVPGGVGSGRAVAVAQPAGRAEPVGLMTEPGLRTLRLPAPHVRSARRFPGRAGVVTGAVEVGAVTAVAVAFGELFAT